jgi:RsiW-degrading membrane proteinase PrsW (M82 family)
VSAISYLIVLLPVFLPIVFWIAYHLHVDRQIPEPAGHLALAFGLGVISFYLGLLLYSALDLLNQRHDAFLLAETNLQALFAYSVLAIGPIEELVKMGLFLLVILRFREFDEPIDGIIYASFIALGFSAVENLHYLQFLSPVEAYARGFAGPVIHIVFASIWGYYIGRSYLCGRSVWVTVLTTLAITSILHGVYDFIVIGLPPALLPVSASLIAGIWIWRLFLIRDLHAAPPGRCPTDDEAELQMDQASDETLVP